MRLVAWNCAMAFHRKLPALKTLRPDVAVIGECASPERFAEKAGADRGLTRYFRQMEWAGTNEHKGLAVLARNGYSLRVDPSWDAELKYIVPVHVDGVLELRIPRRVDA